MPNSKNYCELKNKIQQAETILNKKIINKTDKNTLKKLKLFLKKELDIVKNNKINKKDLAERTEQLIQLTQSNPSPFYFKLREYYIIGFPFFATLVLSSLRKIAILATEEGTELHKKVSVNAHSETLAHILKWTCTIGLISTFYATQYHSNRIGSVETRLRQIYNDINQRDACIEQLKELEEKEKLLPQLEQIYNNIKEKVDLLSLCKVSSESMTKLSTLFTQKLQPPQSEEANAETVSIVRQRLLQ